MDRSTPSDISLEWEDFLWEDPDGGIVQIHGVLPTVVYPNTLRPRNTWTGLALIVS